MSHRASLLLALPLSLCAFSTQAKDMEKLLKGDYAFTGEATCVVSFTGFNADLTPVAGPGLFPRTVSFSVQGVRTFNGDGTGQLAARVLSISHPFAPPGTPPVFVRGGASSADISSAFTYVVSPDRKVTITTPLVNSTILTGTRAGQTQVITHLPAFVGFISEKGDSLTLAHDEPGVEDHVFSNGDFDQRICHRSRILHERK